MFPLGQLRWPHRGLNEVDQVGLRMGGYTIGNDASSYPRSMHASQMAAGCFHDSLPAFGPAGPPISPKGHKAAILEDSLQGRVEVRV